VGQRLGGDDVVGSGLLAFVEAPIMVTVH
jgi:hypothetical protein